VEKLGKQSTYTSKKIASQVSRKGKNLKGQNLMLVRGVGGKVDLHRGSLLPQGGKISNRKKKRTFATQYCV